MTTSVSHVQTETPWPFPWPADEIARYQARRVREPLRIDGHLDEAAWLRAERSPLFRDMRDGSPHVHETQAAVLYDDEHLYVGYWVQEPFVEATITERDDLIYNDNDVELFIAGSDAYYELEINAFGTIYEALFVWDEAYERSGYDRLPGLAPDAVGRQPFNGVDFSAHPRGGRHGFFRWDLEGLRVAVAVDGTLNDNSDRDRGWTVEIAIPWTSLSVLTHSDGRSLPPAPGDTWRMDFSRFNTYRSAPPSTDCGGAAWSPHGVWDSHVPELFTQVTFLDEPV